MTAAAKELRQPVRLSVVARYTGQLAMVWAALVVVPAVVAFATGEERAGVLYAGIVIIAAAGGLLASRIRAPERIQLNEAMIIGCSLFVLSPLVMAGPLMAQGIPFLDAYFESVSGVTTTGLSTLPTMNGRSALFLFARSWTQWYGGLGIVALALALVTRPGALARRLSLTESFQDQALGSARSQFRGTLATYSTITILGVFALALAGTGWFNALVYSLAAVSTGGFAPHDASLAGLGGLPAQIPVIVCCLACAVPLAVYARGLGGNWRQIPRDPQVAALLIASAATALLLTASMTAFGPFTLSEAASKGPILAVSAQTTAGFTPLEVGSLDGGSKLVLVLAMAVGGCAGSTAGGVKILRALILLRVLQAMFTRMRLPKHAVFEPRIGGHHVDRDEIQEAVTIVGLFAATVFVSWAAFVASGFDALDSLFDVVSATGTVGLSTGITAQTLPAPLKLVLCADMLLGRLELVALFVALSPRTWIRNRRT